MCRFIDIHQEPAIDLDSVCSSDSGYLLIHSAFFPASVQAAWMSGVSEVHLVIPHAFGQTVRFVESDGPRLDPIATAHDVDATVHTVDPTILAPVHATMELSRHLSTFLG